MSRETFGLGAWPIHDDPYLDFEPVQFARRMWCLRRPSDGGALRGVAGHPTKREALAALNDAREAWAVKHGATA